MFSEAKRPASLSIAAWILLRITDELRRLIDLVCFFSNSHTRESFLFTHVTNKQFGSHYMQASEADYHISIEINVLQNANC